MEQTRCKIKVGLPEAAAPFELCLSPSRLGLILITMFPKRLPDSRMDSSLTRVQCFDFIVLDQRESHAVLCAEWRDARKRARGQLDRRSW